MPPRALWSGSISFGLVNVPVRLYSAIQDHNVHFHLVHEPDGGRIGYEKVCKTEGKPVPNDEIVKAYEYAKGKEVYLTDEDFDAVRVEGYRSIDITDFVPYEDIDPIFFAHTYFVGPQEGAERVYALLVQAMEDSELAAIAKFVMRDRQYLGCLRVRESVLSLEQMHFADEIRPVDEIRPRARKVDAKELAMAAQLIESFTGDWKPEKYKDTYRDALCDLIEAKRKGKEIHRPAEEPEEEPPDLLAALRASVEAIGRERGKKPRTAAKRNGGSRRNGKAPTRKKASAKK
jgi:DNA end-binding protein Ku